MFGCLAFATGPGAGATGWGAAVGAGVVDVAVTGVADLLLHMGDP